MTRAEEVVPRADTARRAALITGGASGIGAATAVEFARRGIDTVISYLPADPHDVRIVVDEVGRAGGRCVPVEADVRDAGAMERASEAAIQEFGRVDIVVSCAGVLRQAALAELDEDRWSDMMSIDLGGTVRAFRSAASRMDGPGAFVAVSSLAGGRFGWPDHAHYAAAKAGLLGLCSSLAVELAPRGIRVNTVIPGFIESPQSLDPVNSLGPDGLAESARIIPAGRVGTAQDVAHAIAFLTGEESEYITGQQLVVDGGLSVRFPA